MKSINRILLLVLSINAVTLQMCSALSAKGCPRAVCREKPCHVVRKQKKAGCAERPCLVRRTRRRSLQTTRSEKRKHRQQYLSHRQMDRMLRELLNKVQELERKLT